VRSSQLERSKEVIQKNIQLEHKVAFSMAWRLETYQAQLSVLEDWAIFIRERDCIIETLMVLEMWMELKLVL
jgi:hypothetical protein